MNQREIQHQHTSVLPIIGQPGGAVAVGANSLHETADRLLAAGDEAINRILSGDSQAFLEANQQTGGQ